MLQIPVVWYLDIKHFIEIDFNTVYIKSKSIELVNFSSLRCIGNNGT